MNQESTTRTEIAESIFGKAEERTNIDSESESSKTALYAESDDRKMSADGTDESEASAEDIKNDSKSAGKDNNSSTNVETENIAGVKIDPSVLKEKGTVIKSSPTDLYGIALFTNEYEKNVAAVNERNHKEAERLKDSLFIEREDETDKYDQLKAVLFTETQSKVIKETFEPKPDNIMGTAAFAAVLSVLAIILIVSWFDRRSRKRRKDAIDNYTY